MLGLYLKYLLLEVHISDALLEVYTPPPQKRHSVQLKCNCELILYDSSVFRLENVFYTATKTFNRFCVSVAR